MFKKNKILSDSELVAEQLREARMSKKLKLDKIAKKININIKYLEALEKGEFDKLPAGIYGKNFLREYALFLGLKYRELEEIFDQSSGKQLAKERSKNFFSKQIIKSRKFLNIPKIIKSVIIVAIVLICFVYLGVYLKRIISPPELVIISPKNNFVTSENSLIIAGLTESGAEVVINGEPVLTSSQGDFSKELNLKSGVNIIIISAKKKYSRERVEKLQILAGN